MDVMASDGRAFRALACIRSAGPYQALLDHPLTAVLYESGDEIENLLADAADNLKARGFRLAGFVQRISASETKADCAMLLEDLTTSRCFSIAENRGPGARGCKLDVASLLNAGEAAAAALRLGADMLIINKFGKTEHEGGGLRPLIALAIDLCVPVLIAVPRRNWASWKVFSMESARELSVRDLKIIAAGPEPESDRTSVRQL